MRALLDYGPEMIVVNPKNIIKNLTDRLKHTLDIYSTIQTPKPSSTINY
ncbi:MAG: hypothetical protein K2M31_05945 [Muribaculaceae bacterium]|nr:hypothetical protein [Muribaculaceae bacterium]